MFVRVLSCVLATTCVLSCVADVEVVDIGDGPKRPNVFAEVGWSSCVLTSFGQCRIELLHCPTACSRARLMATLMRRTARRTASWLCRSWKRGSRKWVASCLKVGRTSARAMTEIVSTPLARLNRKLTNALVHLVLKCPSQVSWSTRTRTKTAKFLGTSSVGPKGTSRRTKNCDWWFGWVNIIWANTYMYSGLRKPIFQLVEPLFKNHFAVFTFWALGVCMYHTVMLFSDNSFHANQHDTLVLKSCSCAELTKNSSSWENNDNNCRHLRYQNLT